MTARSHTEPRTRVARATWLAVGGLSLGIASLGMAPARVVAQTPRDDEGVELYETTIRPLLVRRCSECHGPKKQKAGLRLDRPSGIRAGSDLAAVLEPGDPDASLMIEAVRYTDELLQMPPKGKLPETEIAALERWVAMGAPMPRGAEAGEAAPEGGGEATFDLEARRASMWALRPLAPGTPPGARAGAPLRELVDAHVLAAIDAAGLEPAPAAEGNLWLRRVTFDLTGLPPTPTEQAAFEADTAPGAHERVARRLLASPRFGERWGRHWLDLVRYAESKGHEFDYTTPNAWQYRDYVIRAFNRDVPFDRFLREHVAGDLLDPPRRDPDQGFNESVLGTGFWFLGEEMHSPVDVRKEETDRVANKIDVFGKAFQGLTVACARCHDHKFDAIPTEDYYALSGYISSTSYRQVRFDSMQANAAVRARAQDLRHESEPELREAVGRALEADAERLPDLLAAAREALWTPLDEGDVGDLPRTVDLLLEDFEGAGYLGWTATGSAFGRAPRRDGGGRQGDVGARGQGFVNTHRAGESEGRSGDAHTGTLVSDPFVLARDHVHFLVGGGSHAGTSVQLLVEGEPVRSTSGRDGNRMRPARWDVRDLIGRTARIRIVDEVEGGWGNVGVDHIVQSDRSGPEALDVAEYPRALAARRAGAVRAAERRGLDSERVAALLAALESDADGPFAAVWAHARAHPPRDRPTRRVAVPPRAGAAAPGAAARSASAPGGELVVHVDYRDLATPLLQDGSAFVHLAAGEIFAGRIEPIGAAAADPGWDGLELAPGTEREAGRLSWVQSGRTLRTPTFELSGGKLYYLARGRARVYAAVASHRLNHGPLHGAYVSVVSGGEEYRWIEHDLSRYAGERVHVEFTPTAGSDFALALVVESASPPPAALALLAARAQSGESEGWSIRDPGGASAALLGEAGGVLRGRLERGEAQRAALLELADWWVRSAGLPAGDARDRLAAFEDQRQRILESLVCASRTAPAMLEGNGVDEHILLRGSHRAQGPLAVRHFLSAVDGAAHPPPADGSGRLALAARLTSDENPLTARVYANRVWHHLFGRGIVASVDDFGNMGEPPSHPQLLDLLARELSRHGWSTKWLVRELVLSRTYRRSSRADARALAVDPENRLLASMPVRRLTAEAVRDSILAVAGELDDTMYGPPVPVHLTPFMEGRGKPGKSGPLDGGGRRSVYLAVRRNFLAPLFLVFDFPIPATTVGRRGASNVPAQALTLMNDPFVVEQAGHWAERVLAGPARSDEGRVEALYRAAYARGPRQGELRDALAFLRQQQELHGAEDREQRAWADLCHVLFNVKEFLFLD